MVRTRDSRGALVAGNRLKSLASEKRSTGGSEQVYGAHGLMAAPLDAIAREGCPDALPLRVPGDGDGAEQRCVVIPLEAGYAGQTAVNKSECVLRAELRGRVEFHEARFAEERIHGGLVGRRCVADGYRGGHVRSIPTILKPVSSLRR